MSDDEVEFEITRSFFGLICPECGESAAHTVNLGLNTDSPMGGTRRCGGCGNSWAVSDVENCVVCDKPLGSADAVCHTCWTDYQNGDLDVDFIGGRDEP